jgi:hypothetical protein
LKVGGWTGAATWLDGLVELLEELALEEHPLFFVPEEGVRV